MPDTYFLLKSEPDTYSIDDLERDGKTAWDGVRNHTAKLHLLAMKKGDLAFIYHSGEEKRVVGVAICTGAARPDPSDETGKFVCVDLAYKRRMKRPVTLAEFKAAGWDQFDLVRMSRLSCMAVPDDVRDWLLAAEGQPAAAAAPAAKKAKPAAKAAPAAKGKAAAKAAPAAKPKAAVKPKATAKPESAAKPKAPTKAAPATKAKPTPAKAKAGAKAAPARTKKA